MMSAKSRWARFLAGSALLACILGLAFALLLPWIHTWGANGEELGRSYPGDELLPSPIISWTHGVTIHARPEQVWPWIAQIGDTRGGFYSYTFIENVFARLGKTHRYTNANQIAAAWQDPQPGQEIITNALKINAVQPGEWLLADSVMPDLGWTWLWLLRPEGQNDTRMTIRMQIQVPGAGQAGPLGSLVDISGFVMEKGMIQGIQDRGQGRFPPAYAENLGIVLWLLALAAGLVGAVLFVTRSGWRLPLAVGLLAVLALFILTFIQPPLWVRVVLDGALLAGAVRAARRTGEERPAKRAVLSGGMS